MTRKKMKKYIPCNDTNLSISEVKEHCYRSFNIDIERKISEYFE